jgi:hypothetical protein
MNDIEMVILIQSVPLVIGIIGIIIMVVKEFRD